MSGKARALRGMAISLLLVLACLVGTSQPARALCTGNLQTTPRNAGDVQVYCGPSLGITYQNVNAIACASPDIVPTAQGQQYTYCGSNFGWAWVASTVGPSACAGNVGLYPTTIGQTPIWCGSSIGVVWATLPGAGCGGAVLNFGDPCNSQYIVVIF